MGMDCSPMRSTCQGQTCINSLSISENLDNVMIGYHIVVRVLAETNDLQMICVAGPCPVFLSFKVPYRFLFNLKVVCVVL